MAVRRIIVNNEVTEVATHMDSNEMAIKKSTNTWSIVNYFLGGQFLYVFPALILFMIFFPNIDPTDSIFSEVFTSVVASAAALVFAIFINFNYLKEEFKIFKSNLIPSFVTAIVNVALTFAFLLIYNGVLSLFIEETSALNQETIELMLKDNVVLMGISIIVLAPILEEIVFRGNMFKYLRKKNGFVKSAVISSLLFGLIHIAIGLIVDVASTGSFVELLNLPVYAGIGYFLALSYEQSGSIYTPILFHMIYNGIQFILMLTI